MIEFLLIVAGRAPALQGIYNDSLPRFYARDTSFLMTNS
jgi:hypothetical protein